MDCHIPVIPILYEVHQFISYNSTLTDYDSFRLFLKTNMLKSELLITSPNGATSSA